MENQETAGAPAPEKDTPSPAAAPIEPAAQPLPARVGDIIRYTPPSAKDVKPAPVFLMRVPSISERAAFQRDAVSRGASAPDYQTISLSLRRGIKEIYPDEGPERLAAFELADEFDATITAANFDKDQLERFQKYKDLERRVLRAYPPFASLYGDQFFWLQIAPLVAVQHTLIGWENVAAPFEKERGMITERALDEIDRTDYVYLSGEALGLFNLTRQTRKN